MSSGYRSHDAAEIFGYDTGRKVDFWRTQISLYQKDVHGSGNRKRLYSGYGTFSEDQFYDVCILGDGSTVKVYKDAVLVKEWNGEGNAAFSYSLESRAMLGATMHGVRGFNGVIKTVAIWDRLLNASEIEQFGLDHSQTS